MKKKLGIALGCVAVAGTLIWGFGLQGFSRDSPIENPQPENNVSLSGTVSIGVAKIRIDNYRIGEPVSFSIPVENGKGETVTLQIACRQPDIPSSGYVKGTATSLGWFNIQEPEITLASGGTREIRVDFRIPANIAEDDFIVYHLSDKGKRYLEDARASTVYSEDALARAFKEELAGFPDMYAKFDEIYATYDRGNTTIFGALMKQFPQYYDGKYDGNNDLVDAWERAVTKVKNELLSAPYASTLLAIERAGSLSAREATGLDLSRIPQEYVTQSDLRTDPWEVWVVVEPTSGDVRVALGCRVLIQMRAG